MQLSELTPEPASPRMSGGKTETRPAAMWKTALRVVGCAALCLAVLTFFDLSEVRDRVANVPVNTLLVMIGLHVAIIVLTTLRFALISRTAHATLTTFTAAKLTFASTLANMLLPTSLAGDAGRVYLVRRHGLSTKSAIAVGVFDRVIGLASLGAVVFVGTVFAPGILPFWTIAGLFIACLLLTGGLLMRSGLRRETLRQSTGLILGTTLYSLSAHAISIVIAFVFLHSQNADVSLWMLAALFPAVLFAASIPVSIGGWGTREVAAVGAFGLIGLDPATAIAMAFLFGVTQTVAAAVGTLVFLGHLKIQNPRQ